VGVKVKREYSIPIVIFILVGTLATAFSIQQGKADEVSFPFESIFKIDLDSIANSVPGIQGIYIKGYLDTRPSGHLWAFIRINYTDGLSDYEKINLQYYVESELEAKWYIDTVEPNYIFVIPGQPIPWPGFVIGDLNAAFINESWNPAADVDHDLDVDIFDIVITTGAYGSTPSDPRWNPNCDIAEPYGQIDIFDLVMIASSYGREYSP